MFKSYFFIPSNKKGFIEKSKMLKTIDHRVFDLEDSVLKSDLEKSFELLSDIEIKNSDWLRIPLIEKEMNSLILNSQKIGINNYVIPKFEGYKDAKKVINNILSYNTTARFILLIENAESYIQLEDILTEFNKCIQGISLGIHDFAFSTGIENNYRLLRNIRMNILLLAKAYSVEPIDVVSSHLKDEKELIDEIIDGFRTGYRSKFLIHPFQLNTMKTVPFYSKVEVHEYNKLLNYYLENIDGKEALFSYNGRVYEKMHIKEIKEIVKWGNGFYGTNR